MSNLQNNLPDLYHAKRAEYSSITDKDQKNRFLLPPCWVYPAIILLLSPITILAYQLWQTPQSSTSNHTLPEKSEIQPTFSEAKQPVSSSLPECYERPAKLGTCFNHLPYAEAPQSDLQVVDVASDGYRIQLRSAAAIKFQEMQSAARREGINIYAISGFRSIALQKELFYGIARQRGQDLAARARVSAPPGYSEHHTGYAVDIGDANNPSTELRISFERTRAFAWLSRNAGRFGFEMSFPKNEPQGISYEPWHWRFVGDAESRAVFRK